MLAEPKRKVKYSLNPRGNEWMNDESKFGKRMLEKMGWSKGKGLGAKEDGALENIRAVSQIGNQGLGWKDKDNSGEMTINYDQALADLRKHHAVIPDVDKVAVMKQENGSNKRTSNEPLTRKEKHVTRWCRNRYSKMLKAKDTSAYSQADMAKIFAVKLEDYLMSDAASLSSPESHSSLRSKAASDARDNCSHQSAIKVEDPVIPVSRVKQEDVARDREGEECCHEQDEPEIKDLKRKKRNKNRVKVEVIGETNERVKLIEVQDEDCHPKPKRKKRIPLEEEGKNPHEAAIVSSVERHERDTDAALSKEARMRKKKQNKSSNKQSHESEQMSASLASLSQSSSQAKAEALDLNHCFKSPEELEAGLRRSGYHKKHEKDTPRDQEEEEYSASLLQSSPSD